MDFTGTADKIADTLNEIIELNDRLTNEIEKTDREQPFHASEVSV